MSDGTATMDEIEIEGCTIKVRVEGEDTAPVLVLSHMLGTDLSLWDGLVPELAKHFRVVRYDARGHGGSGLGDAPVTIERLGRDVVALLDALAIERAHFCGLSMGGAVGLWLLAHAPARIDRAVIAASAAKLGEPAGWNARIAAALADGMDQAVEPTIERWFSPAYVEREPEPVEAMRSLLRATSPAGYAACCGALRDMDLREAVRGVTQPVLVLRGADDPAATAVEAERLIAVMADATAVEIDARHCVAIEAGPAFTEAVVKFLTAKVPARRAADRAPASKAAPTRAKTSVAQGETAAARTKPIARRSGQRGVVAARRAVARTAPISGKAVAKANATRKTAARAAAPASTHRRAAAKATRSATLKTVARREATSIAASTKAPAGKSSAKAPQTKTSAAKSAQVAPARRAPAATPAASARGKLATAASLRAAARPKGAVAPGKLGRKASSVASVSKAEGRTAGSRTAKSGAAKAGAAKSSAAKAVVAETAAKTKASGAKTAPVKTAPAKSTSVKIAPVKTVPAKTAPAKTARAKAEPAQAAPTAKKVAKPAASDRSAPAAKPARSSGRVKP